MGLVTGRIRSSAPDKLLGVDRAYPHEKRAWFNIYLQEYMKYLKPGTKEYRTIPIGIYSGGPNEQGYNNIFGNSNTHNLGNHVPALDDITNDFSSINLGKHNHIPYDQFPWRYNGGNLIYDINRYLMNGDWLQKLTDFGLQEPWFIYN